MTAHDPEARRSHGEAFWAKHPEVVRCNGHNSGSGKRCRFEAVSGSVVCGVHGGTAPQVRKRAAERVMVTADAAISQIIAFLQDPTVPHGVRLKAAQDIADRAGLGAQQVIKVVPDATDDPVLRLFADLAADDNMLESASRVVLEGEVVSEPQPAVTQEVQDRYEQSWTRDAEVVSLLDRKDLGPYAYDGQSSPASSGPPPHIRQGIDREARSR